MDAVEFLKQYSRMVAFGVQPFKVPSNLPYEEIVSRVEKWAKEHPVKTRQSQFLKMFPHPALDSDGVIAIQPCEVIVDACKDSNDNKRTNCWACRRDFWLKEIE